MASPNQVMLLTSISRKVARKVKSNRNRRLRRKRNRKFFLLKLKAKRARRSTDILCNNFVDIFDIQDKEKKMDSQQFSQLTQQGLGLSHPTADYMSSKSGMNYMHEVIEWQHQNQVAYWKSRALALQMENKFLHAHIKFLYDNQMKSYLSYKDQGWEQVPINQELGSKVHCKSKPGSKAKFDSKSNPEEVKGAENKEIDESCLPPSEQPGEARRAKMRELYGEQAAKINGMETAIQLNYEYCVKKEKIPYWPNIPLKF